MRRVKTTTERDRRRPGKRHQTEGGQGPVQSDRWRLMCACGVLVENQDDLADHQHWCQGDAQVNQALIARVRGGTGEVSYERLVAAAMNCDGRTTA
jgi:hypothetical protein